MKRANRMNDNRSGYVFVTSAEKHGRSPLERSENSTFETESDGSSVDRFGRATLETTDPSLQVYPKALRLICFARLSWSARPEARATRRHRRGISTHARYVRPDVPPRSTRLPARPARRGRPRSPRRGPRRSRPAGRSFPVIARLRARRCSVTRRALAARAARRAPATRAWIMRASRPRPTPNERLTGRPTVNLPVSLRRRVSRARPAVSRYPRTIEKTKRATGASVLLPPAHDGRRRLPRRPRRPRRRGPPPRRARAQRVTRAPRASPPWSARWLARRIRRSAS